MGRRKNLFKLRIFLFVCFQLISLLIKAELNGSLAFFIMLRCVERVLNAGTTERYQ